MIVVQATQTEYGYSPLTDGETTFYRVPSVCRPLAMIRNREKRILENLRLTQNLPGNHPDLSKSDIVKLSLPYVRYPLKYSCHRSSKTIPYHHFLCSSYSITLISQSRVASSQAIEHSVLSAYAFMLLLLKSAEHQRTISINETASHGNIIRKQ